MSEPILFTMSMKDIENLKSTFKVHIHSSKLSFDDHIVKYGICEDDKVIIIMDDEENAKFELLYIIFVKYHVNTLELFKQVSKKVKLCKVLFEK